MISMPLDSLAALCGFRGEQREGERGREEGRRGGIGRKERDAGKG